MKSLVESKTFWFNLVTAVLYLANGYQGTITDPKTLQLIGVVVVACNGVLRMFTSSGISGVLPTSTPKA